MGHGTSRAVRVFWAQGFPVSEPKDKASWFRPGCLSERFICAGPSDFGWLEVVGLWAMVHGLTVTPQPESLILAQNERWRHA